MIDRNIFSERLKALRNQNGKTMVDVANALGINKTSVFTWEAQKTIPSGDKLIALADYFNVSIDWLVGRSEDPGGHRKDDFQ